MIEEIQHELTFSGFVRPLQRTDLPLLRSILETWIRDNETHKVISDEVDSTLKAMDESISGLGARSYFVALTQDGNIVGSMGMRNPDPRLLQYTTTKKPVELVNAFVSKDHRRQGIGSALVNTIEKNAKQKGFTELILDSGPRYRFTGWGAWMKLFGQPIAIAKNYYGEGRNAPVWRKLL